jgi:hypothetical protein
VVLNKREKYIAAGTITAVLLLGLDYYVFSPWMDELSSLAVDNAKATQQLAQNSAILSRQQHLQSDWKALLDAGVQMDESHAQSQAREALEDWSRNAGFELESLNPERASQEGEFHVINYNVGFSLAGRNSMQLVGRLLWAIETTPIPVRVNDIKITPEREGTDALTVKMGVSALYMPPDQTDTTGSKGATAQGSGS